MKRCAVSVVVAVLVATVALVGGSSPLPAGATPPVVAEPYVGITPLRVLEPVVSGIGGGPMGAGDVRTLTVTGTGGIPATVEAVDLTVTATRTAGNPVAKVFVSPGGTSTSVPALTVKSIGSRQIATVTVAPSAAGTIAVRADVAVDVQIDVRGYLAVDSGFTALDAPATVLDTANAVGGGTLVGGTARGFGVLGLGGVPGEGVSAVVLRTILTSTTQAGVVHLAPAGAAGGTGEATRFNSASERVSSAIVAVGEDGRVKITSTVDLDVVVVVDGWFDESRSYTPIVPTTVVNNVLVSGGGSVTATSGAVLPDTGVGAVAVQVVATGSTTVGTFSLVAGTGQVTPALSVGGPTANQRGGSVVWTPVRSDGTFDVALEAGMPSTRVTASIVGWAAGPVASGDTTLPTATIESPTPSTSVDASESGSLTMVVAASDAGSGIASVVVTVAGSTTAATEEMVGSDLRWVVEVPAIETGSRTYSVDVTDRAGNVRTVTATYTLTAPEDEEATILDPDTTVVDETVGELTDYDPGTGVMVFDGDLAGTIVPGQILASDPTTVAPKGYLRVVTGVTRTGTATTIQTRQAAITEAVRQADIDVTLPPSSSARGLTVELPLNQTFPVTLELTGEYTSGGFTASYELSGGVTVSVGLNVRIKIGFRWNILPELQEFSAVAEAALTVSGNASVTGNFHKELSRPNPLVTIDLGVIPTPIPGVVLTPEMIFDNFAAVDITGTFGASFEVGKHFQVGVVYDGDTWQKINEHKDIGGGFTLEKQASLGFEATAGLSARLQLSVNDTVGLYVEAQLGVTVSGTVSPGGYTCAANVGLTVTAGTDLSIPLIDVNLYDIPFGEIPVASWDLFSYSCADATPVQTEVEGAPLWIGQQEVVSVDTAGMMVHGNDPVASAGAGVIAFTSSGTGLLPGLPVGGPWVYARNMDTGTTELISVGTGSTVPNRPAYVVDITPNGRYVLYRSFASNLVPGLTTTDWRVYLYDRQTDTTHHVVGGPTTAPCTQANVSATFGGAMSDDARYVLFDSHHACVTGDTNGSTDSFVIDRSTGVIERVSVDDTGAQLAGSQHSVVAISADGRYATFVTDGPLEPSIPSVSAWRTVRRDRLTGDTEVVTFDDGTSVWTQGWARMDASGERFLVRRSSGASLCPRAYLTDMAVATTEAHQVCFPSSNNGIIGLSRDGRYVSIAEHGAAGIVDTVTDEITLCGATGYLLSENARFLYGAYDPAGSVPSHVLRMRCR